jgi:putative Mg2+ transporter-C (MgtC) family protein
MDLTASAIIARIGLAALLGLLVGLDRQHLRKPAGMRTMLMVSFGACLFTLGGVRIAALGSSVGDGFNTDALSRVIQGIVAGIGFLGAGVILRDRGHIRGVTTAAGVWVTAGVGIACGLGEYLLASAVGGARGRGVHLVAVPASTTRTGAGIRAHGPRAGPSGRRPRCSGSRRSGSAGA